MSIEREEYAVIECESCDRFHVGIYSHEGKWGQGAIYEIVCGSGDEWYSEFYQGRGAWGLHTDQHEAEIAVKAANVAMNRGR